MHVGNRLYNFGVHSRDARYRYTFGTINIDDGKIHEAGLSFKENGLRNNRCKTEPWSKIQRKRK